MRYALQAKLFRFDERPLPKKRILRTWYRHSRMQKAAKSLLFFLMWTGLLERSLNVSASSCIVCSHYQHLLSFSPLFFFSIAPRVLITKCKVANGAVAWLASLTFAFVYLSLTHTYDNILQLKDVAWEAYLVWIWYIRVLSIKCVEYALSTKWMLSIFLHSGRLCPLFFFSFDVQFEARRCSHMRKHNSLHFNKRIDLSPLFTSNVPRLECTV